MSHHHHNENDLIHLYEGDQSKLYSGVLAHHEDINSAESKAKVKKIWKITFLLTIITIFEVTVGLMLFKSNPDISNMAIHLSIIAYFIVLTMLKAFYIVKVFMHLGDETKMFAKFILTPLVLILWLATVLLVESVYHLRISETFGHIVESVLGNHKP
ncbi:MAG: cytochrome C oxidase subunit IV family protein [Taibaiella sp.]|nr:cytochrome C oxidase subunit IV family protein [Taibaiella sp.]